MNKAVVLILIMALVVVLTMIPRRATTYSAAAPAGNTNGPYGTPSCEYFYCHGGGTQLMPGWISSDVPTLGYMPDSSYQITVFVNDTGRSVFGFECSPIDTLGELPGTLVENQATTLVGQGKFMTHNAGSTFSPDSNSWTFEWIAPSKGTGTVTFYGSMNAANGDGTASGDVIYHSTLMLEEDTMTVPMPVVGIHSELRYIILSVYPIPASDFLIISSPVGEVSGNITLINIKGQRFNYSLNEYSTTTRLDLEDLSDGLYLLMYDELVYHKIIITR